MNESVVEPDPELVDGRVIELVNETELETELESICKDIRNCVRRAFENHQIARNFVRSDGSIPSNTQIEYSERLQVYGVGYDEDIKENLKKLIELEKHTGIYGYLENLRIELPEIEDYIFQIEPELVDKRDIERVIELVIEPVINTITNLKKIEEYLLDILNEKYLVHNIMYEYADLYTTSIDLLKDKEFIICKNNDRLRKMIRKKINKLVNTPTHSIRRTRKRNRYCFIKVNNLIKNNSFIQKKKYLIEQNYLKMKEIRKQIQKLECKRTKTFGLLGKKMYNF